MNLSVIWRLQDAMTPVMNRVVRSAQSAQSVINRVNASIQSGFLRSAQSVNGLRDKIEALRQYRDGLRIGIDDAEIRRANGELSILQRRLNSIEAQNARMDGSRRSGGMWGLMPKNLALGAAMFGAISTAQGALNSGMEMGKNQEVFKAFVGNAQQAQKILEQLNKYTEKYRMYDLGTVIEGATDISASFGTDKVMPITKLLGDLALGDAAKFKEINRILRQIKSVGHLQGDELEQLASQDIKGIREAIIKFKGIKESDFEKLKQAGLISFQDILGTLNQMTEKGGNYFGMLDIVLGTARGKWMTITGTVRSMLTKMGQSTANYLVTVLDQIIKLLNNLGIVEGSFKNFLKAFSPLFDALQSIAVSFGLIPEKGDAVIGFLYLLRNILDKTAVVIRFVGGMVKFMADMFEQHPWTKYVAMMLAIGWGINKATENSGAILNIASSFVQFAASPFTFIRTAILGIGSALQFLWANPVGLIVLGILALGAAIYYAWNHSETFRKVIIQLWEGYKAVWGAIADFFIGIWNDYISPAMLAIRIGWNFMLNYIYNVLKPYIDKVVEVWNSLKEKVMSVFDSIKPHVVRFWEGFVKAATTAIRIVVGLATLGISEIGILLFKKFKTGYESGAVVADNYNALQRVIDRRAKRIADKQNKINNSTGGLGDAFNFPSSGGTGGAGAGGAGGGAAASAGVSDTVSGAKSKSIVINLNSPIASITNQFGGNDSEGAAKRITDIVLQELNRIVIQGDRLAVE